MSQLNFPATSTATTPAPAGGPLKLSSARLSAVVEAAYILATVRR